MIQNNTYYSEVYENLAKIEERWCDQWFKIRSKDGVILLII